MNELKKLEEAHYFYSRMVLETDKQKYFLYNLSAFLSAARSVLQYACEEAKTKSGGQKWYDDHMKSQVLSFFKEKRDFNVHTQPIQVNQHISIQQDDVVSLSDSITIRKLDLSGQLIEEHSFESSEQPPTPEITPKITYRFTFSDWKGTEDVLDLCQKYLDELQHVVVDGQNKGFLTKESISLNNG